MTNRGNHGGLHNAQQVARSLEAPSNRGQRVPMATSQEASGLVLQQTQLISQRLQGGPRQLIVTLQTPSKGPSGTTPWLSNWNNTTTVPTAPGSIFTAPQLPDPAKGLRCELRWGAGGAAGVTQFDYPAAGACFGLTADTIDLHVLKPIDVGTPAFYTADTVPFVGAFFVEGWAADPTPLRWLEAFTDLSNTAAQYYVVKPYARTVHIQIDGSKCTVDFFDASIGVLWRARFVEPVAGAGIDIIVPVPAQATTMLVGNNSGVGFAYLCVEWNIGLV